MAWTLLDLAEALGCVVYGPVADDATLAATSVGRAVTSTDELEAGGLFVALQGERSHGIEHAAAAFERGAVAVLAGTDLEVPDDRWEQLLGAAAELGPVLVASDCDGVTALGRLARAWRRRARWQVVGITGSSGKTSTKDLLRGLLERHGLRVVASHANWNNEIGVPLTLLAAGDDVDVVICEMGMRGRGQIAYLCDIADPDIGIVTTAGTAHLELLGSQEAIVAAKAELLAGTWTGGVGVFPAAQYELLEAATRLPDRLLPFAVDGDPNFDEAAVRVVEVRRTDHGIAGRIDLSGELREFAVPVHGLHQARNLAAAAAVLMTVAGSTGLLADDALLLEHVPLTAGRGDWHPLAGGGVVIDDAYNANPESVGAALDELAAIDAVPRRVAVIGRMAELGPTSPQLHAQVGERAAGHDAIDQLVVVGTGQELDQLAAGWGTLRGSATVLRYPDVDAAIGDTGRWHASADAVLVKASNSAGLGRLAAALVGRHDGDVEEDGA